MPDLARRVIVPELMDTEQVSFEEFQDCLRDLETINRLTFAYRPTLLWPGRAVAWASGGRPLSILDVDTGHGDMLRRIGDRQIVRLNSSHSSASRMTSSAEKNNTDRN